MPDALLWNLKETARQLGGIDTRTVRRMIARGELPTCRAGARILIPASAIQDWIHRQTVAYAENGVGQSVGGTLCPNEKTKTASTNGSIRRTGGPATPTHAAKELAAVLKLPTAKKPGRS